MTAAAGIVATLTALVDTSYVNSESSHRRQLAHEAKIGVGTLALPGTREDAFLTRDERKRTNGVASLKLATPVVRGCTPDTPMDSGGRIAPVR